MREKDFITIIKQTLNSKYIGDDCAYLEDLGIVVTQDSLVENVHFSLNYFSPYELGWKSAAVNLSDVAASGAEPKYMTISLSLPDTVDNNFVKEFYKGCKSACNSICEIVGGDITGSDKIFISVCAIGSTKHRNISSRKNAKEGYKIVIAGEHGSSDIGLKLLQKGQSLPKEIVEKHLMPVAQIDFGKIIGENVKEPYAMMDTSDGLMDALSAIATESGVMTEVDFDKIPHNKNVENFANWQESVLFGGEDYGLIAVIPEKYNYGTTIGKIKSGNGINLKIDGEIKHFTKAHVEDKIFNHFKG